MNHFNLPRIQELDAINHKIRTGKIIGTAEAIKAIQASLSYATSTYRIINGLTGHPELQIQQVDL